MWKGSSKNGKKILVWLSPEDLCALMSSRSALKAVENHVVKDLRLKKTDPNFAVMTMALYARFYEKLAKKCHELPGDLGHHRLMWIPQSVYELLKVLGFCTVTDAKGVVYPATDSKGRPICAPSWRNVVYGKPLAPINNTSSEGNTQNFRTSLARRQSLAPVRELRTRVWEKAKEKGSQISAKGKQLTSIVKSGAQNAWVKSGARWENVKSGAQNLTSNVKSGAQNLTSNVKSGAQNLTSNVKSGAQNLTSNVKSGAQNVKSNVKSGAQKAWVNSGAQNAWQKHAQLKLAPIQKGKSVPLQPSASMMNRRPETKPSGAPPVDARTQQSEQKGLGASGAVDATTDHPETHRPRAFSDPGSFEAIMQHPTALTNLAITQHPTVLTNLARAPPGGGEARTQQSSPNAKRAQTFRDRQRAEASTFRGRPRLLSTGSETESDGGVSDSESESDSEDEHWAYF